MQVRCIRAAYGHQVGDLVEVPDGASVSPVYFEPVAAAAAAVAGPAMPPPEPIPPAQPADTQGGA